MDDKTLANSLNKNFKISDKDSELLLAVPQTIKKVKKGERIYSAGDEVSELNCILSGWLTSVGEFSDGSRQLMGFHVPIDFIGLEFISENKAMSSLIAFKDSTMIQLPVEQFRKALQQSEQAAVTMLEVTGKKYLALQGRLCVFSRGNALDKVSYLLLGLRAKQLRNEFEDPNILRLPLTQHDIADTLGLTNVTVSRIFTHFAQEELVTYQPGQVTIQAPERLRASVPFLKYNDIYLDEFG